MFIPVCIFSFHSHFLSHGEVQFTANCIVLVCTAFFFNIWCAIIIIIIIIEIKVFKNIILPVFYGCETWSETWREEHSLKVFDKRVWRRIFGPKRDEVAGEWTKITL
jgi:hypothetical protein